MPGDEKEDYLWYRIVPNDTPLAQGDLIDGVNVYFPLPPEGDGNMRNEVYEYNVVVMTQTCDLAELKDDEFILLCPLTPFIEMFEKDKRNDNWNKLVKNTLIHNHLINKCEIEGYEFDFQVVFLDKVISMQFGFFKQQLIDKEHRVRMLPPYREYLAQAFARQFMRIGLPNDMPRKCPY